MKFVYRSKIYLVVIIQIERKEERILFILT